MNGQSPESAIESAETTSTAAAPATEEQPAGAEATTPNNDRPEVFGTRLGALLSEIDMPEEVRAKEIEADKRESEKPGAARTQAPPTKPAAGEKPAAGADDDAPLPDEWPESARTQVMAERHKRQKRTEELTQEREKRETSERRVKELEDQFQGQQPGAAQAAPIQPGQDPTARIFNFTQLNKAATDFQQEKRDHEELLDFTAANPRGIQGVLLGHDKDGNEIRKDYDEDQIAEMRVKAQRRIREVDEVLKPGGTLQRRSAYLHERSKFDPLARQLYSDKERTAAGLPALGGDLVFDKDGQLTQDAKVVMQSVPGLTQHSDVLLNVGRYLRGLQLEQKELESLSKKGKSAATADNLPEHLKPFARPTPPIAPSAPAARTPGTPAGGGRGSTDVDKAEQRVIETGGADEEAIDELFEASLGGSRAQRERAPA
jgi:hypothetical protein